jgi:hypothetical protein
LGVEFLQTLIDENSVDRGYSAINTARSALSAFLVLPGGGSFGEHPRVKLFMRGVFNDRPPVPRYQDIWDTDVVLDLLKTKDWIPAGKISIQKLSQKVTTLILICSGQRPQILKALSINNMDITGDKFIFTIDNSQVKQGRLGYKPAKLELKSFPDDKRICVYRYLKTYLKRTLDVRGKERQLLLTLKKPHRDASQDTMSRWVKTVLSVAGVDTKTFKAGSTRAATTSKAKSCGAPLEEILKGGGWSRATTFSRWYDKPVRTRGKSLSDYVLK